MDGEFSCASTRRHCFGEAANVAHFNLSLHFFLVDVVNGGIGDCEHTLLRPLQVVDLFDH